MVKEILELIENIYPAVSTYELVNKLDEIDLRVALFVQEFEWSDKAAKYLLKQYPQYTRSRDALKQIRPKYRWTFMMNIYPDGQAKADWSYGETLPRILPTEELAELHSILQVIEWERNNERS